MALIVENKADIEEVRKGDYSAAMAVLGSGAPAASAAAPAAAAPAPAAAAASAADVSSSISALPDNTVFPSARLLMAAHGVNPAALASKGTGKGGRITKGDVLVHLGKVDKSALAAAAPSAPAAAAAKPVAAAPAPPKPAAAAAPAAASSSSFAVPERVGGTFTDVKPSTVRKVIASRLTESKAGIPHQYAIIECRLDALMKLRSTLKEAGANCSVNDMVIKAAAKALRDVPEANAFYDPKRCVCD